MAVMGSIIGIILVSPFYYVLHTYGVDLTPFLGPDFSAGGVALKLVLYCNLTVKSSVMIFSTLFLLTILSAVYPSLKAAFTMPIKTIREI